MEKSISRRTALKVAAAATGSALLSRGTAALASPSSSYLAVGERATKTIAYWWYWPNPNQVAAARAVIAEFQKENPDIAVKMSTGVDEAVKLPAAIAAGNPPDVTHSYNTIGLAARGALMPLDSYIAASKVIKKSDYSQAQWDSQSYNGHIYGVPAQENGPQTMLCWNKGLFEKAGLDPEKGPSTLAELVRYHEKITQVDSKGNVRVLGFDPLDATGYEVWELWLRANGLPVFSPDGKKIMLNQPKMVEGVNFISQIYKKIGPDKIAGFRTTFGQWTSPGSAFPQGRQGMQINGYWTPGELKKSAKPGQRFGYGLVPVASGKRFMALGGHSVAIPRGAKDPETAFKLIEFLTTPKAAQIIFDGIGFLNGNRSFFQHGNFSSAPDVQKFLAAANQAQVVGSEPLGVLVAAELQADLLKGIDQVNRGQMTAQDMLASVQSRVQTSLDQQLQSS